jgi:hypothetical protein
MATIAYEAGKANISKDRMDRYRKYFMKHVVRPLEFKVLGICDPGASYVSSRFRKLQYKLPKELKKFASQERQEKHQKWD